MVGKNNALPMAFAYLMNTNRITKLLDQCQITSYIKLIEKVVAPHSLYVKSNASCWNPERSIKNTTLNQVFLIL